MRMKLNRKPSSIIAGWRRRKKAQRVYRGGRGMSPKRMRIIVRRLEWGPAHEITHASELCVTQGGGAGN